MSARLEKLACTFRNEIFTLWCKELLFPPWTLTIAWRLAGVLVDLVIVRPDEFSGSETSALSENPARNFINIISEIDIGTSVCVCVCVCVCVWKRSWKIGDRGDSWKSLLLNETSGGGDRGRRKMRTINWNRLFSLFVCLKKRKCWIKKERYDWSLNVR